MDFGTALSSLRRGEYVTRKGWNGPGMWVHLQKPDEGSKMTLEYLYMRTVQGDLVPWLISMSDLLAEDWVIVLPVGRAQPLPNQPLFEVVSKEEADAPGAA